MNAAMSGEIEYQKRRLDNGLEVVAHHDSSDPLVAVYVAYHVGSAREVPGRTGFAHLFEHMLFQGSAHVPEGEHFKRISAAGGSLNGTTSLDRTVYFETLPARHLELALWLESDRMGFLLPAMTQKKLDNQRDVVMNERRQNYDNRPYGRVAETIAAQLFAADHPYHWLPIGSMDDIAAATLEDVDAFFRRWYGPNNATLCIAGDIECARAFELAEKWFGELPRGPRVEKLAPRPTRVAAEIRARLEDRVALPQISLTWAGAEQFSADSAALNLLAMILSQNKASILDRALTVETTMARALSASHWGPELAGRFDITVRASPDVTLEQLEQRVRELLAQLGRSGIDADQLARMKTRCEADIVRSLQTVVARAGSLAESNVFTENPGYLRVELEQLRAVTPAQVGAALERYVLSAPAVVLATVPADGTAAAPSPRPRPQAVTESAPLPTSSVAGVIQAGQLDRSQAPESAPLQFSSSPPVRTVQLANGAQSGCAEFSRAPWCALSLALPMGRRAEPRERAGIASLSAAMFSEGTRRLSTTEVTDALDRLGASLSIGAADDEMYFSLAVLEREFEPALELLVETLLEPRWDPRDFERVLTQRRTAIATRGENPTAVAQRAFARLMYGDTSLGRSGLGSEVSLRNLKLDEIARFCNEGVRSAGARLAIASPLAPSRLEPLAQRLLERLPEIQEPALRPALESASAPRAARVFLIDRPGAAQTELRIGHMSVPSTHADFFPLAVLNYLLGGSFSSRINLNLREARGFTYGARSHFAGGVLSGPFAVAAAVETSVTAAAAREILNELEAIRAGLRPEELAFAKEALGESLSAQYENADSRRALVDNVLKFGWPSDYPQQRVAQLERLSLSDLDRLAREHLRPEDWCVLAVGDAKAIGDSLQELGLGAVRTLDIDGV
jgi:zinc protease